MSRKTKKKSRDRLRLVASDLLLRSVFQRRKKFPWGMCGQNDLKYINRVHAEEKKNFYLKKKQNKKPQ